MGTIAKKRWYQRASVKVIVLSMLASGVVIVTNYQTASFEINVRDKIVQQYIKDADAEISNIKAEKQRAKEEAERRYAEKVAKHTNASSVEVIVNKRFPIKPLHFVPDDLVTSQGVSLSKKAIENYHRMVSDAASAGQAFRVTSSFRSYEAQAETYDFWIAFSGQSEADRKSAKPGFSEHQTGFVIDVAVGDCVLECFKSTSQYQWLQKNAAKYGFIQRYRAGSEKVTGYAAEEWHYRFIGVEAAQDMARKGVATLEEYWGLEGGSYR